MTPGPALRTDRLLLRRWTDADLAPFATMNADPEVMHHFPDLMTTDQTVRFVDRIEAHFDEHGFGLWVVEVADDGSFAGFVGLSTPMFEAHFTPTVEVGWRLAASHWGRGYATEAALASLRFGFETMALPEIVSFTIPANLRSERVMQRLGMHRDPADDFDHPRIPPGNPARRHVLYRLRTEEWAARQGS